MRPRLITDVGRKPEPLVRLPYPTGGGHFLIQKRVIEKMAYQIWEMNGRPSGHDKDHWYKAEKILAIRHLEILRRQRMEYL